MNRHGCAEPGTSCANSTVSAPPSTRRLTPLDAGHDPPEVAVQAPAVVLCRPATAPEPVQHRGHVRAVAVQDPAVGAAAAAARIACGPRSNARDARQPVVHRAEGAAPGQLRQQQAARVRRRQRPLGGRGDLAVLDPEGGPGRPRRPPWTRPRSSRGRSGTRPGARTPPGRRSGPRARGPRRTAPPRSAPGGPARGAVPAPRRRARAAPPPSRCPARRTPGAGRRRSCSCPIRSARPGTPGGPADVRLGEAAVLPEPDAGDDGSGWAPWGQCGSSRGAGAAPPGRPPGVAAPAPRRAVPPGRSAQRDGPGRRRAVLEVAVDGGRAGGADVVVGEGVADVGVLVDQARVVVGGRRRCSSRRGSRRRAGCRRR